MKKILMINAAVLMGTAVYAQSAVDAYRLSQPDMKGTARFMSMGGAFTALGGDLSTLSQNPAGIGVYRNNEVGFTLDLDLQKSESNSEGIKTANEQTKFLLNNIGFVWTIKLPSSSCPNINAGFTYNKTASFNRRYEGTIPLNSSLSNYIAGVTTMGGYSEGQLLGFDDYGDYDPYNPPNDVIPAPWLSILGYQGYLFNLEPLAHSPNEPNYQGQWRTGTSGFGQFFVQESGAVDSYNIALGGNIANVVFWGMDFDITHINYNLTPQWTERLQNAYVEEDAGVVSKLPAQWSLNNYYNCSGTGFNYKLGVIVKPIQEFRIGFAFHTPTWYGLTETFDADIQYLYDNSVRGSASTNDGYPAYNNVNFRTPWKITAGAAAVLFNRLIISADYEWTQYKKMKYSTPSYYGGGDYWWDDPWYDDPWYYPYSADPVARYVDSDPYYYTNKDISTMYCNTNTFRLGAEFRITPQLSVRAGYSCVSSPINSDMKNSEVETAGTIPNYRLDNTTNYVSCGLGYKIKSFYIDAAYTYKHMESEYHAYSPLAGSGNVQSVSSPVSSLSLNNSQIVLSAGFKF